MTVSEKIPKPDSNKQRYLELAIPLLSFGATLAGVLLWNMGYQINFQYFAIGCVLASCILAYLAYNRPKKDIVALSTPIYAFIFFVVPTEYMSGLILQMLYAVSLTLLLVRLKYRFGLYHTDVSSGKELSAPLKTYADQTRDVVTGITPEDAHRASMVVSLFSTGDYAQAALSAGTITGQVPAILTRAFAIVREHAAIFEGSLPRPESYLVFAPEDEPQLAKVVSPEFSEDRKFDTTFDNAMLLLFSAAWNTAEADRSHLIACQRFLQKLIEE
jgi:hypothetical protein